MEDLKQAAGHYTKAMESVKQAREELSLIVIKYIIANGVEMSKCTELAISENLGLPRNTVRNILSDLLDEGIVEVKDFGNVKPYTLNGKGIGIALDWMNLSFTREEVNELLGAKEAEKFLTDAVWGAPLIMMEVDGKRIKRFRGCPADACLTTFTGRFLEYIDGNLDEELKEAFGERTLKELELLCPEINSFEKITAASPFPVSWITKELRAIDEKPSVKDVKRMVIDSFERNLKFAVKRLKKFASILEEKGYGGMHESFKGKRPTRDVLIKGDEPPEWGWRFRDEFLWATTLALRESCRVGEKIGANTSLLKEARLLADVLDLALERKYGGVKSEGSSLMEWGLKRLSSERS